MVNLLFLLLCVFQYSQAQYDCPDSFVQSDETCYRMSTTEATWAGAIGYCQSVKGGRLASIQSESQQQFLQGYIAGFYNETNVTLATKNDYVYHYLHDSGVDIIGHTSITFKVKACHDAHVALSKDKGVDSRDTYEIVIGGWSDQMSVIRDCKQCANMDYKNFHHHPVDCNIFKPFWVSWADNIIRVGTGNIVGKGQFMVWNDTAPHEVNYVGVATGFGSSGEWWFEQGSIRPGSFWIGATDLAVEGEWMWLPSLESLDYTNWATGEPDNTATRENCAVMNLHNGYKWSDDDCEERRNFICQVDL